jgi:hypothetical protein
MSSDIELNEIGVLKRREIEARILSPILEALGNEFGRKEVIEITRRTITEIARQQGRELAEQMGFNDLESYGKSIEPWSRSGALQLRILNQDDKTLSFDVTECKYAELYSGTWKCPLVQSRCCVYRGFQCRHHTGADSNHHARIRVL